ncbi:MAG: type II secretion system GspH family protein [Candidatus Omnitrophica bacterium]|nr:type II secretion system GspH family protein [Candidatus Omnitrophota bacterium]MBU1128197.1 type II secretion system GspH family protein [Candidatus Omnitrophota bacterium]MBU1852060.1 type II secretion system GspH family protein [Candidatus Omnitrophota bacterium]
MFIALRNLRGQRGFTLVEILFVVVVIGILAAIVIPRLTTTAKTAKIAACDANVASMNNALERYYFHEGSYPTLLVIGADADYFPDGLPACPYADAYVLDADNRVTAHDHSGE